MPIILALHWIVYKIKKFGYFKVKHSIQCLQLGEAWWPVPVIPVWRERRQKEYDNFETVLQYVVNPGHSGLQSKYFLGKQRKNS